MKRRPAVAVAVLAVLFTMSAPLRAAADDVAVVVNKSNTTDALTMAQLRKILLAEEGQWSNGKKIVIYLGAPGQPERSAALKVVCGMTETDFNLSYMHATFNGGNAEPPKVASAVQAKQAVAAGAGAVALIKASEVDDSVKVLKINGLAPGQPAYPIPIK